jgi:hypothetical protein
MRKSMGLNSTSLRESNLIRNGLQGTGGEGNGKKTGISIPAKSCPIPSYSHGCSDGLFAKSFAELMQDPIVGSRWEVELDYSFGLDHANGDVSWPCGPCLMKIIDNELMCMYAVAAGVGAIVRVLTIQV